MRLFGITALLIGIGVVGCSQKDAEYPESGYCRDSAGRTIKRTARVTGEAVEGGVETGWAGVKQTGKAVGGFVTGGAEGAEEEWDDVQGRVKTYEATATTLSRRYRS